MTVPADEITRVKALGCLHNKGTDNFNIRVITRNGKVTAAEQMKIAEAAEKFGSGDVVMTTRLTMEIVAFLLKRSKSCGRFWQKRAWKPEGPDPRYAR